MLSEETFSSWSVEDTGSPKGIWCRLHIPIDFPSWHKALGQRQGREVNGSKRMEGASGLVTRQLPTSALQKAQFEEQLLPGEFCSHFLDFPKN